MRTRVERAQALLLSSGLPQFLWKEAMNHSTWLQNRSLAYATGGKTPYEMRHKRVPNLAGDAIVMLLPVEIAQIAPIHKGYKSDWTS